MYVYNCDNSYKSESLWLENFIFSLLQLVWILKNVCITSQKRIEQAFWIPTFHVIQENLFFSFFLSLTMDHLKVISLSPGLSFSHKTDKITKQSFTLMISFTNLAMVTHASVAVLNELQIYPFPNKFHSLSS